MAGEIKNLVICSTLNQITNYLVIKALNPEKIINITYDEETKKGLNKNIKMEKWDENLNNVLKVDGFKAPKEVAFDKHSMCSLSGIKQRLEDKIGNIDDEIYWHITGGQRIIALAIMDFIRENDRSNDRIIYVEGNSEELIINDHCGDKMDMDDIIYGFSELEFSTVLRLMGFNANDVKSTGRYDIKSGIDLEDEKMKFYTSLYGVAISNYSCSIDSHDTKWSSVDKEEKEFMEHLFYSNKIAGADSRKEYVNCLFKKLEQDGKIDLKGQALLDFDETINKGFPSGYIFENMCAYKILEYLSEEKSNVIKLATSLKINKEGGSNEVMDELDIVLLTDTGKIINFECKVGDMKGDNAKSHNYTTYRLAGVFGMPILLSPLRVDQIKKVKGKDNFKKQLSAYNAAERADLKVIHLDMLHEGLGELLHK